MGMDRSANMRAIRSTGMKPELAVRKLVHGMGYRYRLHRSDLPGKPDLVFSSRQKIIFVHGCFWHSHSCKLSHTPKSNASYWNPKLHRNKERDAENLVVLKDLGWSVLIVWECETREVSVLKTRLRKFLNHSRTASLQ